jgi:hypothetical protein
VHATSGTAHIKFYKSYSSLPDETALKENINGKITPIQEEIICKDDLSNQRHEESSKFRH